VYNNNNYDRRTGRKRPERDNYQIKSEYDKQKTQEEVAQIKKNLINFARTSWGQQWIHSILNIGRPFRMQRGIQYAKDEERIENLTITKGQIFSTVQGTAPTPYRVKVKFDVIPEKDWQKITNSLSSKKKNLVELLEGKLPQDILTIFEEANYPLFLDASKGLDATCSCPDQAIPCKHIAATILYIARVIDYNPFILLELRGKSKEDILHYLSLLKKSDDDRTDIKSADIEFEFNIPKIPITNVLAEQADLEELSKIGFKFKKPGKIIETLENLGIPPSLNNPKAFETVLDGIYRTVTTQMYSMAMKLEKSQK